MSCLLTPQYNLSTFSTWLYQIAEAASTVTIVISSSQNENKTTHPRSHVNAHSIQQASVENNTIIQRMEKLNRNERWALIKQEGICRKCLNKHTINRCDSSVECGINGCKFKHHRLLHNDNNVDQHSQTVIANADIDQRASASSSATQVPFNPNVGQHNCAHQQLPAKAILFRKVPVTLFGKDREVKTYAFLDEGSSLTMLDESIATQLELKGTPDRLCLKWTADTTREDADS